MRDLKTDRSPPQAAAFRKPKRSPLWIFVWLVLAVGLIGNLAIVAFLFLGMLWS